MVLNRNPKNYFAEVEQIAFSPASLVPGIEPSPDKMLQVSKFDQTAFCAVWKVKFEGEVSRSYERASEAIE